VGQTKNVGTDVFILVKFMSLTKNVSTHVFNLSSYGLAKTSWSHLFIAFVDELFS
jgi:hypothetical protein